MLQFLRISRLTVPVLTPITSPISLRLIGLCSNLPIVNRCSLVKAPNPDAYTVMEGIIKPVV